MRVSLGAIPYFWSRDAYYAFYESTAESPVDIVYIGETICSKRRSMRLDDWLEIARMLSQRGKQVVLSTLTLLEADSELKYLTRIASQKEFLIEANDMAAVEVAAANGNEFVAGCSVNAYNTRTLATLGRLGMKRWCVPVELGREDLKPMLPYAHQHEIEVEYHVFGRMPLAYSARCFTARHLNMSKDDCQFRCQDYQQGIAVYSQEKEIFSQINGIQTQSGRVSNLVDHWNEIKAAGIDIMRVVPVSPDDTLQVLHHLHALITGEPVEELSLSTDYPYCNGYWLQQAGMANLPV